MKYPPFGGYFFCHIWVCCHTLNSVYTSFSTIFLSHNGWSILLRRLSLPEISSVLLVMLLILVNLFNTKHASASVLEVQPLIDSQSRNIVRYCVDPDWLPYEAIVDGRHTGVSSDYLALLTKYTGLTFMLVPTTSWRQSLELLKQGRCELTPILNQTPKRDQYLYFSEVFFKSPNVLVSLKSQPFLQGFENIGDRLLAIPKDYRLVEYIQQYYPNINTILTNSERQGLEKSRMARLMYLLDQCFLLMHIFNSRV